MYSDNENTISLEMSNDEYCLLLFMLGYAIHKSQARGWAYFANRINAGNPNFIPYDIPDKSSDRPDTKGESQ